MAVLPYPTPQEIHPAAKRCDSAPERTPSSVMQPPDPIPRLKDEVARAVVDRLDGWAQIWAADFLHTDQPRMSNLRNGRLGRFSLQQLIRFASRMGADVQITITWTTYRPWLAAGRPDRGRG